ncbi:Enhancer of split mbeta protein [Anthophora retusa]
MTKWKREREREREREPVPGPNKPPICGNCSARELPTIRSGCWLLAVAGLYTGCRKRVTIAPHTSYAPIGGMEYEEPVSRTYQYRKVMKPMLERKRRARINRCLDELKDLMVTALQAEGENVAKLEKADILELTVRHLHTLRAARRLTLTPENSYADRFREGFTQCAQEVSSFLSTPVAAAVHPAAGAQLMRHLGGCLRRLEGGPAASPLGNGSTTTNTVNNTGKTTLAVGTTTNVMVNVPQNVYTPPQSPVSVASSSGESSESSNPVWRPW